MRINKTGGKGHYHYNPSQNIDKRNTVSDRVELGAPY